MEFFFLFMLFFFSMYDFFCFYVFFLVAFFLIGCGGGSDYFGGFFFMDFVSFYLVFLSMLVFFLCVCASVTESWVSNSFFSFLFLLGGLNFFVFLSFFCLSVLVFYMSFEFIFVLMFFFLLNWGYSPERLQASFYMIFYTVVVSFPFLVGISFGGVGKDFFFVCFDWDCVWGFFFIFVFLVKLPVYGVHLWLPKAHVEAPLCGSMILAGVLLKLGGYGMIRLFLGLNSFLVYTKGIFVSLGLLGGLWSCVICLRQSDLKAFVAYSSVCHMGFMLGGLVSLGGFGKWGSILMMISHGFCSSGLFYILYVFYERFYTRSVMLLKGLGESLSLMGMVWFVYMALNMGVPPSLSFFSEILIFSGLLGMSVYNFVGGGFVLFFGGLYGIFMYVICFHGNTYYSGIGALGSIREYFLSFVHFFYLIFCVLVISFFF